jgi:hypothetical protein
MPYGLAPSGDTWSGGNTVKMDGAKRHGVVPCTYGAKKHGVVLCMYDAKGHGVVLWDLASRVTTVARRQWLWHCIKVSRRHVFWRCCSTLGQKLNRLMTTIHIKFSRFNFMTTSTSSQIHAHTFMYS